MTTRRRYSEETGIRIRDHLWRAFCQLQDPSDAAADRDATARRFHAWLQEGELETVLDELESFGRQRAVPPAFWESLVEGARALGANDQVVRYQELLDDCRSSAASAILPAREVIPPPTLDRLLLGPKGLGGWLTLVGLGLIISMISITTLLLTDLLPALTSGQLAVLRNPTSEGYHPLWAPGLIGAAASNAVLLLLVLSALILFFRRSARFPALFICYCVVNLLCAAMEYYFVKAIPALAAADRGSAEKALFGAVLFCGLWIPYVKRSRRVRNTFVEPRAPVADPAGGDAAAVTRS